MQKAQSTPLKSSTNKVEHGSQGKDTFSSPIVKKQPLVPTGENNQQVNDCGASPAPTQKKLPSVHK